VSAWIEGERRFADALGLPIFEWEGDAGARQIAATLTMAAVNIDGAKLRDAVREAFTLTDEEDEWQRRIPNPAVDDAERRQWHRAHHSRGEMDLGMIGLGGQSIQVMGTGVLMLWLFANILAWALTRVWILLHNTAGATN
jgi:hypothetical protein